MGSDMSMEMANWKPRRSYAEWYKDELLIYKDTIYDGFKEIWRGPVNNDTRSLILTQVNNIPEKPEQFTTVQVRFTPEEYNKVSTAAAWEYHGDVNGYIKALALGFVRKGC